MTKRKLGKTVIGGKVAFYRRASTKAQEKSGGEGSYKHQLLSVQSIYPDFTMSPERVLDFKEVMSGFEGRKKRVNGKLGSALKALVRDPTMTMIVSHADRISRKSDIFLMIQEHRLGHRVYDVSTGKSVSEIIECGQHLDIEKTSLAARDARAKGRQRHKDAGGEFGWEGIGLHSQAGIQEIKDRKEARIAAIADVVRMLSFRLRGKKLSFEEVVTELDHREVRTGQGDRFTSEKLRQFRRNWMRETWRDAQGAYHRSKQRLKRTVGSIQAHLRASRLRREKRARHYLRYRLLGISFAAAFRPVDQPCAINLIRYFEAVGQRANARRSTSSYALDRLSAA